MIETEEIHFENPASIVLRREVIAQQDQAYKESLEVDMAKEESKRVELLAELTNTERQENLMNSRYERVPEEPMEGEDKVFVRVRHTTIGMVKRSFTPTCKMNAVYDWVGLLSLTPQCFYLTDFEANIFKEVQSVRDATSVVLYMRERDEQPVAPLVPLHEPNELIFLPNRIMEEDERYGFLLHIMHMNFSMHSKDGRV